MRSVGGRSRRSGADPQSDVAARKLLTRRGFLHAAGGVLAGSALPWPVMVAAEGRSDELARLDATAQAALVRSGQVTPLELVDAAIARIEALNPELNAFVTTFYERAREQARGALPDGPFRGVPYGIKDLSDYEGTRTSFGSRLFAENIAGESNGIVQRSLAAGLVPLGKTNTPEFGLLATTESMLLGPTRNPWSLEHHAGGSSGGAAAAVAAGMLPFAQASDGGGSIRVPASVCGVFGLKPSRGRIFRTGDGLPGDIAVRFAVSRSVRDSATLLSVCEHNDAEAAISPVGIVSGPSSRRLKIAFSKNSLKGDAPDPEVARAVDSTAVLCAELGHELVEAAPAVSAEEFLHHFFTVWASGPAQLESMAWLIGLRQLRLVRARDVLEPWTLGLAELYDGRPAGALEQSIEYFDRLTREFDAFFQQHDVLLTPVLTRPPLRLGEQRPDLPFDSLMERVSDYVGYTAQHNAAGTPAMSVPLSMSSDGLPIGSQFAARVGDEQTLLELAFELEQARPWGQRWAPHSAVGSASA